LLLQLQQQQQAAAVGGGGGGGSRAVQGLAEAILVLLAFCSRPAHFSGVDSSRGVWASKPASPGPELSLLLPEYLPSALVKSCDAVLLPVWPIFLGSTDVLLWATYKGACQELRAPIKLRPARSTLRFIVWRSLRVVCACR
jgi:hypothetical protein